MQNISLKAEGLVKRASSAWLNLRGEIAEPQRFINALYELSLLVGDQKAAKLEDLKAR